jgi:hypothetical protein
MTNMDRYFNGLPAQLPWTGSCWSTLSMCCISDDARNCDECESMFTLTFTSYLAVLLSDTLAG